MSEFRDGIDLLIQKGIIDKDYDKKADQALYWPVMYWLRGKLELEDIKYDIKNILSASPESLPGF